MRFTRTLSLLTLLLATSLVLGAAVKTPPTVAQQRLETLADGTQLLAGVTLAASTPIAEINADHDGFDGKVVQIEGVIVEICDSMGCWVELRDAEDNALRVKVDDGVVDFRELVSTSQYMVAEGVFQKVGEHGAQVFIMEHGAMVSGSDS